jgi:hypothetical protein
MDLPTRNDIREMIEFPRFENFLTAYKFWLFCLSQPFASNMIAMRIINLVLCAIYERRTYRCNELLIKLIKMFQPQMIRAGYAMRSRWNDVRSPLCGLQREYTQPVTHDISLKNEQRLGIEPQVYQRE